MKILKFHNFGGTSGLPTFQPTHYFGPWAENKVALETFFCHVNPFVRRYGNTDLGT